MSEVTSEHPTEDAPVEVKVYVRPNFEHPYVDVKGDLSPRDLAALGVDSVADVVPVPVTDVVDTPDVAPEANPVIAPVLPPAVDPGVSSDAAPIAQDAAPVDAPVVDDSGAQA